jgi:hypothetical protein
MTDKSQKKEFFNDMRSQITPSDTCVEILRQQINKPQPNRLATWNLIAVAASIAIIMIGGAVFTLGGFFGDTPPLSPQTTPPEWEIIRGFAEWSFFPVQRPVYDYTMSHKMIIYNESEYHPTNRKAAVTHVGEHIKDNLYEIRNIPTEIAIAYFVEDSFTYYTFINTEIPPCNYWWEDFKGLEFLFPNWEFSLPLDYYSVHINQGRGNNRGIIIPRRHDDTHISGSDYMAVSELLVHRIDTENPISPFWIMTRSDINYHMFDITISFVQTGTGLVGTMCFGRNNPNVRIQIGHGEGFGGIAYYPVSTTARREFFDYLDSL